MSRFRDCGAVTDRLYRDPCPSQLNMIRFDKLTVKAQEALHEAQSHASEKGHPQVAPEHLLWALIQQKDGVVLPILQKLGVNLQTLAQDLATAVGRLPLVQ